MSIRCLIIPNFVADAECTALKETAERYFAEGLLEANKKGPKRFFKPIFNTPLCDELMIRVARRVFEVMELQGCEVDPYLGWVISYILPGGFIRPHRDDFDIYAPGEAVRHLRCNVMVARSDASCNPLIDSISYPVEENSLWAFFASESEHGTRPITGDTARIVYQFGFTVPQDYSLDSIEKKVTTFSVQ